MIAYNSLKEKFEIHFDEKLWDQPEGNNKTYKRL
jgi:hypothetical protein